MTKGALGSGSNRVERNFVNGVIFQIFFLDSPSLGINTKMS